MSDRVKRASVGLILAACLGAPVLEMFDRWDDTLRTGNDTEATIVIVALCIGAAFVTVRMLPKPHAVRLPAVNSAARSVMRMARASRPTPALSPPTILRV